MDGNVVWPWDGSWVAANGVKDGIWSHAAKTRKCAHGTSRARPPCVSFFLTSRRTAGRRARARPPWSSNPMARTHAPAPAVRWPASTKSIWSTSRVSGRERVCSSSVPHDRVAPTELAAKVRMAARGFLSEYRKPCEHPAPTGHSKHSKCKHGPGKQSREGSVSLSDVFCEVRGQRIAARHFRLVRGCTPSDK